MKQMPAVYLLLLILLLIKGSHCIISLAELNKDTLISLNISSRIFPQAATICGKKPEGA
jgi:hypothetical protein